MFHFREWEEDIVIIRNWSLILVSKHAINDVELVDWEMLKFTYPMRDDYVEVTEYINLE